MLRYLGYRNYLSLAPQIALRIISERFKDNCQRLYVSYPTVSVPFIV